MLKQIKNLDAATTPQILSQFDYTYRPDNMIETWAIQQGGGDGIDPIPQDDEPVFIYD